MALAEGRRSTWPIPAALDGTTAERHEALGTITLPLRLVRHARSIGNNAFLVAIRLCLVCPFCHLTRVLSLRSCRPATDARGSCPVFFPHGGGWSGACARDSARTTATEARPPLSPPPPLPSCTRLAQNATHEPQRRSREIPFFSAPDATAFAVFLFFLSFGPLHATERKRSFGSAGKKGDRGEAARQKGTSLRALPKAAPLAAKAKAHCTWNARPSRKTQSRGRFVRARSLGLFRHDHAQDRPCVCPECDPYVVVTDASSGC
ncbi:hypothetical protein TW95_gp1251 [Pandoravirus inopinatum]|uniref:Uncharacterized protein n=1 Tax=Pandoravirus inopinatum TaxID=1605721 RepID=A0A0B5J7U0_9VIRU|nr:hypothetical protein TW95_gp1251 [Pandoravirus inopinatum]AJF97985.1 hypothetical protein [Pandoravirus inopinatum]